MSEKQNRSWQEIFADAYKEQDPQWRQQLSEELERCLQAGQEDPSQNPPESKKQSAQSAW